MEKNAKSVGRFSHARSGCMWYRTEHPMKALEAEGIAAELLPINGDIEESTIDSLMSVHFYGAHPFSMEPVIRYLKSKGIRIVYDMDDALDLIDPSNPFYHSVKRDSGSARQMVAHCDILTASTPQIASYALRELGCAAPIKVVPNCYVREEWDYERKDHEGIRIGFAGASPHVSDLIEAIPSIRNLQSKYPVKFYIMGFGSSDYASWYREYRYIAQPEATEELRKLDELLSTIQYEWVPFVDYSLYPKTLIGLSLDIGICPLKDTPFNNCRSASKAMEYALAGALALASDTIPYQNEPTSVLVKEGCWEEQLEFYIRNPEIREKVRNEHLLWIHENRNLETKGDLLKSVYVV